MTFSPRSQNIILISIIIFGIIGLFLFLMTFNQVYAPGSSSPQPKESPLTTQEVPTPIQNEEESTPVPTNQSNESHTQQTDDIEVQSDDAPIVSFISPLDGQTIGGQIVVRIDVQSELDIVDVELIAEGDIHTISETPPYQWTWNVYTAPPAETYTITVRVIDSAGNVGEDQATIHLAYADQMMTESP